MGNKKTFGHLAALLTIIIWGTTFISTKILLVNFKPVEILFFRFIMGFLILLIIAPKQLKTKNRKEELTFIFAGLCGICLYYLLENMALTYTLASNVGVIISIAPFFTAIFAHLFTKSEEKLSVQFFAGFVVAMIGIVLISFNGKIFYGILFMIPTLFFFDFRPDLSRFADMTCLFNILYLGLGASALCFVTWNFAVKELGAVKTSVYIYMVPVITAITSVLILHENLTLLAGIRTMLT